MSQNPQFIPTPTEEKIFTLLMEVVDAKTPTTVLRVSGGCVRDKLLGIQSQDIDIAIDNMTGEEFCKLIIDYMREKKNLNVSDSFSVVKVNPAQSKHLETAMMKLFGLNIDFVNLRKESYSDSRIPVMEIGTPQEDAQRRDLTINALFYNINTKSIEDFVGGILDLDLKIARTPIDPIQTFIDDPLRILRVIRFASKYDLTVDQNIIYACHDERVREALQNKVTPERKWKEIGGYNLEDRSWKCGFLATSKAHIALELIYQMKLLDIIFEDQNLNFHQAYYNLSKFRQVKNDKERLILNLVTLFQDKDNCDINFEYLLINLYKAPKDIFNKVEYIYKWYDEILNFIEELQGDNCSCTLISDYHLRLYLSSMKEDWLLGLYLASMDERSFTKEFKNAYERLFNMHSELGGWKVIPPITGKHLIEIGFPADKSITEALKNLDDELLRNPKMTKEEALKFCEQFKSKT